MRKKAWLKGFLFLVIIIFLGFVTIQHNAEDNLDKNSLLNQKKENERKKHKESTQHDGWKIESDASGDEVLGSNLFYNGWCTEGNGYIYTLNMAFYGEEQEDNDHNIIYRFDKCKNQWEIVVSYAMPQEEHLYDENGVIIGDRYVRDLTYYKGYVYYILVNDYCPGEGSGEEYYLCRVSEQSGQEEKLGECFSNFYIYNDKIYYMTQNAQEDIRFFWEMTLDGSYTRLIHCQKPGHCRRTGSDFAVGGGSLYWGEEGNIRAINLETKKEKVFAVNFDFIDGIYYENGNLYVCTVGIYQLDLSSGDIKKIAEAKRITEWIHNGYLYYVNFTSDDDYYTYYFWRRNLSTN